MITLETLYKTNDLPRFTGVKRAMIYKLIKAGAFPAPRHLGRTSVWTETDLLNWQKEFLATSDKTVGGAA